MKLKHIFLLILIIFTLVGCKKDEPAFLQEKQITNESVTDEVATVDYSQYAITDKSQFQLWSEEEIRYVEFYHYKLRNNGFTPIEIDMNGKRERALYHDAGVYIIEHYESEETFYYDRTVEVQYNGKSVTLELPDYMDYLYVNICYCFFIMWHDFTGDLQNELAITVLESSMGYGVYYTWIIDLTDVSIIEMPPYQEVYDGYITNVELVSREAVDTDTKDYTALEFKLTDKNGKTYMFERESYRNDFSDENVTCRWGLATHSSHSIAVTITEREFMSKVTIMYGSGTRDNMMDDFGDDIGVADLQVTYIYDKETDSFVVSEYSIID